MNSVQQNQLALNNQPLVIGEFSIRQDDQGRYCLNDLHKASGEDKKHFPAYFIRNQQTKELIELIESESYDMQICTSKKQAVNSVKGKGKQQGTYVVKELVYAYAMWISAKFHLQVIRAYDSLTTEWLLNEKQTISPTQAGILYNIVHARAEGNQKIIMQMWSRLKSHFKYSASYRELKAFHFEDAKHYLEVMDIKVKKENSHEAKMDSDVSFGFNEQIAELVNAILEQNCTSSSLYRAAFTLDAQNKYLSELVFKTNLAVLRLTRAMGLCGLRGQKVISDDLKVASYTTGGQHQGSCWFHPLVESGKLMGALHISGGWKNS